MVAGRKLYWGRR